MRMRSIFGQLFFRVAVVAMLAGCGGKDEPEKPAGDPEQVSDFIRLYPERALPWQLADSLLLRKEKDSAHIKKEVFVKFIPDSILVLNYNPNAKVRLFPLGRVEAENETYLFTRTSASGKTALLVTAFDKNEQFTGAVYFVRPVAASLTQGISMDRKHTLTRTITRKNSDGTLSEGKDVFVLNAAAREFTLIMTESLDDKQTEIINPIDTLPRTHKYAADYSGAKMNLISIRDGRKPGEISFYVHIEKNNRECTGELKGEAVFVKPNVAKYQQEGDPCVLQFTFGKNSVTLKEIDACGNRRGLQCTFDGSHAKKKAPKPASK